MNAFVDHAGKVKLGEGVDESTTMGPLVSKEQQERVERYIEIGIGEATLVAKGETPDHPRLAGGYFVPPTVFADVTNDATIAREEIFGPVMSVMVRLDEDVIAMATTTTTAWRRPCGPRT